MRLSGRFIVQDMHMRPASETTGLLEQAGFEFRAVQAMGEHDVRTVRHWLDTFGQRYHHLHAVRAAG